MEKIQKITYKELVAEKVNDFNTTFVIEPLARGYANTMGTVLRRTLLSSITSVAPFAIKINNVEHEFQTISGLKEDAITLVRNIRNIRFVYNEEIFEKENLAKISFKTNKEGEIFASDIPEVSGLEIVNKDQYIANIAKGGSLEFDLFLRKGRGFIDFEENKNVISQYGSRLESSIKNGQFLAMDSDFSPVKKCAISFEELNSSSKLIEERLKIKIETDCTVSAKEAIEQAAKIIVAHFQIIGNINALETIELFEENKEKKEREIKSTTPITKLGLSVRSENALRRAKYNTVEEVLGLSDEELSNIKNLGKKSIQDIIEKRNEWKERIGYDDGQSDNFIIESLDQLNNSEEGEE
ncbi:DNA-directed RNA polymerase subunit alpha [Mycoplasmopsis arginini]|uniref:DNA-directed RNA polymerase subunit alpha n=3 Tax=Mycoplasmatota TaxID=544448 RepID=RPOA_MYCSP|nr:DNA-directed RNA polymerase subunit alpha [Mycoplasmopsis arginini]P38018.2 RecName: Full=DNA-directed RNA polymerase subunit alpha; Short=RNAP subunit alpha; AltName: Full=RNA polymerase subunit alpha; AltName: Full=Transcriptase subunit alpha [Mycoplasma sp.]AAA61685.2 RNA polymerase alpha subunit [Chlamydia muridarum]ENY69410.1 DNA-directed RNA polymerase alpha chain [Mycoplasmopsis arginini 7264]MDI3349404.1 DNA-directed RNA polymerase subunit alpha [Mycoplasmopsis arginini]MDP4043159.1